MKLAPQVEDFRMKLLTRKEYVIRGLFGKPDAEELLERSQKIYIYYITPGPKCKDASMAGKDQKALTVRFDALGKVREIMVHDAY
ncbi:outer membrane protein assembly factor BamE domain-containing protein [Nibribacter koreensis]